MTPDYASIANDMRAVRGNGGRTLHLARVPLPAPAAGEVLVQLRAVAVTPADFGSTEILGCTGAGIVVGAGPQVALARLGEEVWLLARNGAAGTCAEYAALPAEYAVPLPAGIGYEQAATLGASALVAHHALLADGEIRGKGVFVADAAGAVGSAAVQLAKWAGARVIASVGNRPEEDLARTAGADDAINCRCRLFGAKLARAASCGGVHRWIAAPGKDEFDASRFVVDDGVIIRWSWEAARGPVMRFLRLGRSAGARAAAIFALPLAVLVDAANDINAAIAAGALRPVVAQVFRLEEAGAAHALLERGGVFGSLVLRP